MTISQVPEVGKERKKELALPSDFGTNQPWPPRGRRRSHRPPRIGATEMWSPEPKARRSSVRGVCSRCLRGGFTARADPPVINPAPKPLPSIFPGRSNGPFQCQPGAAFSFFRFRLTFYMLARGFSFALVDVTPTTICLLQKSSDFTKWILRNLRRRNAQSTLMNLWTVLDELFAWGKKYPIIIIIFKWN